MATWNKNTPTSRDPIRLGDDEIRNMKDYIEDALSREHVFPGTYGTDSGEHIPGKVKVVQIVSSLSDLDIVENGLGFVTSKQNLYSNDGTSSIRVGTASFIPSGTKMLFAQDTAPPGWSIVTTLNDGLAYVTKGSAAGGDTGGAEKSGSSWTITGVTVDDHDHTYTVPDHQHEIGLVDYSYLTFWNHLYDYGQGDTLTFTYCSGPRTASYTGKRYLTSDPYNSTTETTTTASVSVNHDGSWRPAYLACIVCEKD